MGSMSLPQAFVICQVHEKSLLAWNPKGPIKKNTIILQWWSWYYFSSAIVRLQFYRVKACVSCALSGMFVHFTLLSLWIAQHSKLVCVFTLSKAVPPGEAKDTKLARSFKIQYNAKQKYCWLEQVLTPKLNASPKYSSLRHGMVPVVLSCKFIKFIWLNMIKSCTNRAVKEVAKYPAGSKYQVYW